MELTNYQKEAVKATTFNRVSFICSKCGSGKTVMALKAVEKNTPTLIICPAFVKDVWKQEIKKWLNKPSVIYKKESWNQDKNNNPIFVIVSYSTCSKLAHFKNLINYKFKSVVLDEAHFLKNPDSKRTKAILGEGTQRRLANRKEFKKIVLLSATLVEKAIELFSFARAFSFLPDEYNKKADFGVYFCRAYKDYWGQWRYPGTNNLPELLSYFGNSFISIDKKLINSQLPPITHSIIRVDSTSNILMEERELLLHGDFKNFKKIPMETVSRVRAIVAEEKFDWTFEYIQSKNLHEEKVVVFCHHKVQIEKFKNKKSFFINKGTDFFILSGDTPIKNRSEVIKKFNLSKRAIIICSISASNVGISLHTAQHVIFSEISWSWADNEQAFHRVWRKGVSNPVTVHWITVRKSIDDWMLTTSLNKKEVLFNFLNLIKKSCI